MVYQRILKLPCEDVRSGIGFKSTLDAGLKQLMTGLFTSAAGFKVQLRDDPGEHLQVTITRGPQKIKVEGRYGQNSVFAEGKKAAFVSYTIRAENVVATLDRAENAGENMETIGKIAGVVLSVAAVCAFMNWIIEKMGMVIYSIPIFVAIVYAGKWLGGNLGRWLANELQTRATNRALSSNDMTQADAVWERLTNGLETVTSGYPVA